MRIRPELVALVIWLGLAACASESQTSTDAGPASLQPGLTPEFPSPTLTSSHADFVQLRPRYPVVETGDVADWPGGWSPDGRFYVFFRWQAGTDCSGESVHAYDTLREEAIQLSSADYCTTSVDPNLIWEGDSRLILRDGPGGLRWEAITLGDDLERVVLDAAPPACVDREFPLPPALAGVEATRARWSPDEAVLALALVPEDEAFRFDGITGNRPERASFQRLQLAVFPAGGAGEGDLQVLGPVFDLAPDDARDEAEDCPGTQIRWSDDGQLLISSMGPVVYEVQSGEALLLPDGPTAGPLGPNVRWSADERLVADDQIVFELESGVQHAPPGILPGYDRGFGLDGTYIYVNALGMASYDPAAGTSHQLTDFKAAIFVVAPDGSQLVYVDDGTLWLVDL